MMRCIFAIEVVALIFGYTAITSCAEAQDTTAGSFTLIDAEELIDHCHDAAAELFEGDTIDIEEGYIRIASCLRSTIVDQLEPMFEPGRLSPEYAEWMLVRVADPVHEFYYYLFNAHTHCDCGESYFAADVKAGVKLYERLLRDVVDQRNTFRM